ncbi:uncharacterized protein LOC101845648 isoform X1 [Aplysia californica]|uniref:Uncharacterized protein LOC101845648 isoform X1 n=1 Tax=Aplysia californica TaxID=6500 RepID=A0ABM1A989_APLCA|nr:uncharacterized protein LOC101845648 isoform X1 [Aplysia californica]
MADNKCIYLGVSLGFLIVAVILTGSSTAVVFQCTPFQGCFYQGWGDAFLPRIASMLLFVSAVLGVVSLVLLILYMVNSEYSDMPGNTAICALLAGRNYNDLQFSTCISPSALCQIIPETCRVMWDSLVREYYEAVLMLVASVLISIHYSSGLGLSTPAFLFYIIGGVAAGMLNKELNGQFCSFF